jgi:hypothetical protein
MLRIVLVVAGLSLSLTTPVLSQSTTPTTGATGERLTCSQPVPALDLGTREKPSDEQAATLCACIWGKLGQDDRDYAEGLKNGKSDTADTIKMDRFSNNFGSALEGCSS